MDRLTAEIQAATDRVAAAEQAAAARAAELTAAYRAYQAGLTELRVDDPDELIELVRRGRRPATGRTRPGG